MFFAIALCVLSLLITVWYCSIVKRYRQILNLPGPPGIPILGNVLDLGHTPVDLLNSMQDFMLKYGDTTRIKIFNRVILLSRDPKFVEFITSSTNHITKSYEYKYLNSWLGNGLLLSTGSEWKTRRRILTPAFHFKILEQFADVFNNNGNILVDQLNRYKDDVVDIYPYITRYSLDVICETAMGTSVNAQIETESKYVTAVKDACQIILNRTFSAWKQFDWPYIFSNDYRLEKNCLKELHGFSRRVIAQRRASLLNKFSQNEQEQDDFGMKKKIAFLDILLTTTVDGDSLTDEEIREEVDTFMFEGHDTTSSGITFCLYEIANNPDVQKKIIEELQTIFHDDKDRVATNKDFNDMKYLEMVLKETLRLYPSVPFYAREMQEDTEYNGLILPKGISITLFVYSLHRNPAVFENPDKFDPDRYLPENIHKNPYVYLPFSAGPRNCIGQKFAMLEMKAVVSKLLRNFELSTAGRESIPILASSVILKSENGVKIRLKPRKFL